MDCLPREKTSPKLYITCGRCRFVPFPDPEDLAMLKKIALFALAGLIAPPLFGQVYKCPDPEGKPVYQEMPCAGKTGTVLEIETGKSTTSRKEPPSETRKATDEEAEECLKLIKIAYRYKDPESLRIEENPYMLLYPDGHKEIVLSVNGKNSYGAYAGAKLAICKYQANGRIDDVKAF